MNPQKTFQIESAQGASGARILSLSGPLTLQTLFDFQDVARREKNQSVVLDISGVPYMDSAGLGCIVSVYTSCQGSSRGFAITGITERIRTLFQVTRVDGLLPCFESLAEAEAAVANGKSS